MFPSPASVRWSSSAAFSAARRPSSRSPRPLAVKAATSGSSPEARPEVRLELARLEQQPRAETPDVPVGDLAAVVERQQRAPVSIAGERAGPQRARHAEVDQQRPARREADDQILPAPVDVLDALAGELRGNEERILGPSQPDVADLDVLEPSALECRRDRAPNGFDLRQLRQRRRAGSGAPRAGRRRARRRRGRLRPPPRRSPRRGRARRRAAHLARRPRRA